MRVSCGSQSTLSWAENALRAAKIAYHRNGKRLYVLVPDSPAPVSDSPSDSIAPAHMPVEACTEEACGGAKANQGVDEHRLQGEQAQERMHADARAHALISMGMHPLAVSAYIALYELDADLCYASVVNAYPRGAFPVATPEDYALANALPADRVPAQPLESTVSEIRALSDSAACARADALGISYRDAGAARLALIARAISSAPASAPHPGDHITARMFGQNLMMQRCEWMQLRDESIPGSELHTRASEIVTRPVDSPA